jgi:pSer/pThr/pTyr-binding forkhead associated (FHA) protein
VSGLHAQITRVAGGGYLIRDQGSVAGTWVNYEPVPAAGRSLEHGDLIHVGRVGLRFRLAAAPEPRRVRVTRLDSTSGAHQPSAKDS